MLICALVVSVIGYIIYKIHSHCTKPPQINDWDTVYVHTSSF